MQHEQGVPAQRHLGHLIIDRIERGGLDFEPHRAFGGLWHRLIVGEDDVARANPNGALHGVSGRDRAATSQ
jgi:hypothetical protein